MWVRKARATEASAAIQAKPSPAGKSPPGFVTHAHDAVSAKITVPSRGTGDSGDVNASPQL